MAYNGITKGSRSLDLALVSQVIDAGVLGFMAYSPEQLGVAVPIYAGVRTALNMLQAYLRFKTTTPVGEKDVQ